MGAVTADEMRKLEEEAFRQGSTAAGLMKIAGRRLGLAVANFFPQPGTAVAFLGKGHNAGDALVALRILRDAGWRIAVRAAYPPLEWATLTRSVFRDLGEVPSLETLEPEEVVRPLVLLDGLLGIGARGGLRKPLAGMAAEMRHLREVAGARIVAVDLPSGVDPDDGEIHPGAVHADLTLTIGAPKKGLLLAKAADAVGALGLIPLMELPVPDGGALRMISPQTLAVGRAPRPFDFHKGRAGRVGVLAGSSTYTGAAVLAATGALRGGAGLVTLYVPPEAVAVISAKCPPEVMVRGVSMPEELLEFRHDSLVVGPGLGTVDSAYRAGLTKLLQRSDIPAVIDADALNALAVDGALDLLSIHHVLTPHPGEFQRLAPDLKALSREEAARAFAGRHAPVLLLKGARTLIAAAGGSLWVNSTGTPGMSSGGQGDALSGVIGALLAGGIPPLEAAGWGAWLCGRASERAISAGESEESLLASDTLAYLGGAFRDWREGAR